MKEPLEPMRRILVIALLFGFYVNNNNYTFLNVTGTNFSNTQYIKKPLSYRVGYTLINNVELEKVSVPYRIVLFIDRTNISKFIEK